MIGMFDEMIRRGRRCARVAVLAVLAVLAALPPAVAQAPVVGFGPAPESKDYLDLFTHPERWAEARSRINVFGIGPAHLRHGNVSPSFEQLVSVDAFRKLQQWGIKLSIGVGAIKNWDCAAQRTPGMTIDSIADVHRNGGVVSQISMDEPLLAAIRPQTNATERCKLTLDVAADEVAAFVRQVTAGVAAGQLGPAPAFIDTESYPSVRLEQHEAYVTALLARGFHPAGYSLDIATAQLERQPGMPQRFPADLRALKAFLDARQIPLGIIIWSSRSPELSDQAYYEDTLAFARQIHSILGQPPRIAFSSWVRHCARTAPRTSEDCPKNVPVNLPDHGPGVFSHTKLILDVLGILAQP